ncbi:MAG: glycosyltransferase [Thermoplasmata archaeon]|nr:glycosyltransferase [Thermoplasmata archaeon]
MRAPDGTRPDPWLPSLGVVVTVFHRTRFYPAALASIAAQTGPLPRVEVVVVRSPDLEIEVPVGFKTRGWSCEVVRSDSIGEGSFFDAGLRRLTTDVVVPLDDDDLWEPGRLRAIAETFRAHPRAGYFHNGQSFVDVAGAPVDPLLAQRHLRRFSGAPRGRPTVVSAEELRRHPSRLARWGSVFNNSSVAIRRDELEQCSHHLRGTAWLLDAFLFYAAASGGSDLVFDPAPWTRYRIHSWNKSRGSRTLGLFGTAEPTRSREGRLASVAALRTLVDQRGAEWLDPWLERERAYLDLLEGLREGDISRLRSLRRALRLGRYVRYIDPLMNVLLSLTALGQTALPQAASRAYWVERPLGSSAADDK